MKQKSKSQTAAMLFLFFLVMGFILSTGLGVKPLLALVIAVVFSAAVTKLGFMRDKQIQAKKEKNNNG